MAQKRDRLELIKDILQVIQSNKNQIKPTPLLRYSNLSSQRFTEYIAELLEKQFIEEKTDKKSRKFFSLTEKGQRYLEKYTTITKFIEDFDL
ncbi:MAG: winged helix DNA-binding protein [Nanoarchaeota archaeon]|nr:winged helix DNA-binding protein [Nanoarchaeota archaeon]MBU0977035.1 winged helix DNA-binding protein [Nanoarchaeota archaeon]